MHIRERIALLKMAAANVPLPEGREEKRQIEADIADLEWEDSTYNARVSEIKVIAVPLWESKERERLRLLNLRHSREAPSFQDIETLWRGPNLERAMPEPGRLLELSRHEDLRQKLDEWIAQLQVLGLLTVNEAQRFRQSFPRSPGQIERDRREAQQHQRLFDALNYILATIPDPWDRRMALQQFNLLDGPFTEHKFDDWLQRCVAIGVLPMEWLAGRRLGGALHKLFRGEVIGDFKAALHKILYGEVIEHGK